MFGRQSEALTNLQISPADARNNVDSATMWKRVAICILLKEGTGIAGHDIPDEPAQKESFSGRFHQSEVHSRERSRHTSIPSRESHLSIVCLGYWHCVWSVFARVA